MLAKNLESQKIIMNLDFNDNILFGRRFKLFFFTIKHCVSNNRHKASTNKQIFTGTYSLYTPFWLYTNSRYIIKINYTIDKKYIYHYCNVQKNTEIKMLQLIKRHE